MLSVLAYVVMLVGRIPIVPQFEFLHYDPKDIIIAIGGFIYGPMAAFLISLVVSLVEMLTVSTTLFIGFIMNVIQSTAFACTAAFIYKKRQTMSGAIIGLIVGMMLATGSMLLWNYLVTPLYTGMPREAVAGLLLPVFLPFNLLKGGLNAGFTMLLYKPVVTAMRKANLAPPSSNEKPQKISKGFILVAALVVVSCVLFILAWWGIF